MATQVEQDFEQRFSESQSLTDRARAVLPGGLSHDSRYLPPFPVYISRAEGSHKWTEEGHELIDLGMGHGSLILGHGHPAIKAAIAEQLERGTHFSAAHRLEVEWAERIVHLVPSAELVRFTGTGTEATLLSMRLARAHTGRPRFLKLHGHFHGWHDEAIVDAKPPYDGPSTAGYNPATVTLTTAIPPNDVEAMRRELETEQYAGVILEPSGGSWGTVPLVPGYLEQVRELTARTGTLLVFDEVVTGFRFAPGGAQELYGVVPDLTALAKILAGGLPGGAVTGRREIVEHMAFRGDARDHGARVAQHGTFNANPLSAAAGIAALDLLQDGAIQRQVTQTAARLCEGMNDVLQALDLPGCAYRTASLFHVYVGEGCPIWVEDGAIKGEIDSAKLEAGMPGLADFRHALNLRGVDLFRDGGILSVAHSDADVDAIVGAFESALRDLGLAP
ncbi:MAG: aminotransferase class III-fold pyridoxal phosphate-dependent enzyme [Candidatus Dormibacteraeota bacterium]|nr:aminotransferase class III-fold pyridoxal phosphate-dependent enzyme [Candidatus Dormibacteraeota bacterium]MBO0703916.1 aminotransferase class III-fold pyridoxal phosphate-dependent enzyme [Candidatus Dormibacteraeota bacterium]MBO0760737.1 aminotransferase class III-fold pyridoxal phosphate-dependent enzyme [Candidatus Dormibacteraeota bacterium]